jgi:hypothetical protein
MPMAVMRVRNKRMRMNGHIMAGASDGAVQQPSGRVAGCFAFVLER